MTTRAEVLQLIDEIDALIAVRLKAADYKGTRRAYTVNIFGAMNGYLTMGESIVSSRNEFRREAADSFLEAFNFGYEAGGGSAQEEEDDDKAWLGARLDEELGYIVDLFDTLKAKKEAGLTKDELKDYAHNRADAYTQTLDNIFSEGKMRGAKNVMLTMVGDDGKENCPDCRQRKGKRYSVRKWMTIGYPPSSEFECGGFNCAHFLVDDSGKRFTL